MELYILRHAETDFNKAGIVQGRGVNSSINELGRRQAQLFYEKYKEVHFDALFASSLLRTYQTIELFKGTHRVIHTDAALDEISWGRFEGLKPTRDFSQHYHYTIREWNAGNFEARIDGGESVLEVNARQMAFMNALMAQPFERVLICTHGRALRILMASLLHNDLRKVEDYEHNNTGLYVLKMEEGQFSPLLMNDTSHLLNLQPHVR